MRCCGESFGRPLALAKRLGLHAAAGAIDFIGQSIAIVVSVIDVGAVADLGASRAVAFAVIGIVVGAVGSQAVVSSGRVAADGAVAGLVVGVGLAERAAAGGGDLAGGVIAKGDGAIGISEGFHPSLVVVGPGVSDQRFV